jgi:hypothetical protein
MFDKIGTGKNDAPLVLAELNQSEKDALARILNLAEAHLDEIQFGRVRNRRGEAEMMIAGLRQVHEIEG